MTKLTKICSALVISFTAYIAGVSSSEAISLNLSWTGSTPLGNPGPYSLTGSVTAIDGDLDNIIDSKNPLDTISSFSVTFRNPAILATYNTAQIKGDTQFNFVYNTLTQTISQDSGFGGTSFSVGLSDIPTPGYYLDSTTGSLSFVDNNSGSEAAIGGTLTATPVPFEFEGSAGILTLGAIWGVNKWRKNRIKK